MQELLNRKQEASYVKAKRGDIEKEIYRLENFLKTLQRKRGKVEKKNLELEDLKIEKEEEIKLLHLKIEEKEDEIKKSEKLFGELKMNIDEIVGAAIKY